MQQGILDQITTEFLTKSLSIFGTFFTTAQHIFIALIILELAWGGIVYALNKDSLGDMVAQLVKKILIASLFLAAITNAGEWVPETLNYFIKLGSASGGITSLDPSSVAAQGLSISAGILKAAGLWGFITDPLGVLIGGVASIGVVLFYGLIAAELAITLIESYFLVAFSPIFFAFGANKVTHSYATNYINAVVTLGVKLMTLYVVIGVGSTLGQDWAHIAETAAENEQIMGFIIIFVAALIYFLIAKRVPAYIAQIISGSSLSSGAEATAGSVLTASSVGAMAMGHAKTGMKAAGMATGGVATAGAVAAQAGSIAMSSAASSGATTPGVATMSGVGGAVKHMGGAMADNFKSSMKSHANKSNLYRNMANRANSLKQ